MSYDKKLTNPKDAIGSSKLPLHLVPDTLVACCATALLEGALKYGAHNWRAVGVRASIYRSATGRHLAKWWNGEDHDPVTGVHHLDNAIACLAILRDSMLVDKLTDDRPPSAPLGKFIDKQVELVAHLKKLFANENPRHWSICDDAEIHGEPAVPTSADIERLAASIPEPDAVYAVAKETSDRLRAEAQAAPAIWVNENEAPKPASYREGCPCISCETVRKNRWEAAAAANPKRVRRTDAEWSGCSNVMCELCWRDA